MLFGDFEDLLMLAYPDGDVFPFEIDFGVLLAAAIDMLIGKCLKAQREAVKTGIDMEMELDVRPF